MLGRLGARCRFHWRCVFCGLQRRRTRAPDGDPYHQGGHYASGHRPRRGAAHPGCETLENSGLARLQRLQQLPARHGIAQALPQGLLVGERIEQLLVVERGGEQEFPLAIGQSVGRKSAQQILDVFILHDRFSQLPPINSKSRFRQRASQV